MELGIKWREFGAVWEIDWGEGGRDGEDSSFDLIIEIEGVI